jgi:hypothetical protein
MTDAVRKPLSEVLDQALEKLVMICPNKKTFDELTSVMFQLYCGNDFGMGNASVQFLEKLNNAGSKDVKKSL